MPRELKRTLGDTTLSIRLWTLKDKARPMFRARRDDVHILEVSAKSERHNVILKEKSYTDYTAAKADYEHHLRAFGHSMKYVKRKQSP
jgi:hypothetical protein